MTIIEWFNNKFNGIFRKKLAEAEQVQKEIDKVLDEGETSTSNNAFAEKLKDDNPVYDSSKSFVQKFNDLVVAYQRVESNLDSDSELRKYSDEDVIKIALGARLERLGVSGVQALEWIKRINRIDEEQPLLWPVRYSRDGKTTNDPPILIPATRELDILGFRSSEDILKIGNVLKKSIRLVDGDNGFEVTTQTVEKYHGEDCTVDYSCSYIPGQDTAVYRVNKFFDPKTTSENGIHHSIAVTKKNGQITSLEEIKEGYLEDSDNYYFRSSKNPEDSSVHVICGRKENGTGNYDISYEDNNLGVHSYDNSIAKYLNEKGLSSQCAEGRKIITKLSAQMKKTLNIQEI